MTRRFSSISVQTTLATGISNTALSMVCATGTASNLLGGISLAAGNVDQFKIIIDPDMASSEIMYVTGVTSDTLTIQRGKDGTSAVSHTGGAVIKHVLTGEDLTYFATGVAPTADLANTGLPMPGSTSGINTLKAPAVTGTVTNTLPATTGTLMSAESVDAATSKTTPVDADEIPLADSAASFGLKKLTWANIKVAVFTAIGALTGKTTPVDADTLAISDSAASSVGKSLTLANLKKYILNSLTTAGDIFYATAAGVVARLPIGSTGNVLTVAGGVPTWDSGVWTARTPTVTSGGGTFTTVSASARYKIIGKMCIEEGIITVTTVGSAVSYTVIDLPATAYQVGAVGAVKETALTNNGGTIIVDTTTRAIIHAYNGATMAASGASIRYSIIYEVA